ncbi:MAG: hypothetical protein Q7S06_03905 [Nanoarchaeota archaeon]|nr:hypothetical protein [Nanoarchaeota archaeon]
MRPEERAEKLRLERKKIEEKLGRKLTPTEIIESVKEPHLESTYVKTLGELFDVSKVRTPIHSEMDKELAKKLIKSRRGGGKYIQLSDEEIQEFGDIIDPKLKVYPWTLVHVHSIKSDKFELDAPSRLDLAQFLLNEIEYPEGAMFIAVTNEKTGKDLGYILIRKTKKTPKMLLDYQIEGALSAYMKDIKELGVKKALDEFSRKAYLQWGAVSRTGEGSVRGKYNTNIGGLERTARAVSIIAILGSMFFFSFNITGNAISNLSRISSNWIGGVLFFIGVVGSLFCFRNKLKTKKRKGRKKKK